jgi:hypothetical protein
LDKGREDDRRRRGALAFFYEAPRAPDWNRSSIAEVFFEADIVEVLYQMREALKYAR